MPTFGYFLSCEEFGPTELVRQAKLAEQAGFRKLWISDHFHPWNDQQGQSPFVWSVIGALSQATHLPITTAVTCPTVRVHPAVIAQAAATAAVQTGGRFTLGVGTGEALNDSGLAFKGARILVLGVAYKRGIGDTRESPAFEIIAALRRKGAEVSYADPHVPALWVDGAPIKAVDVNKHELESADCVLVLTDHPEFDYAAVAQHGRLIVDTRHSVPSLTHGRGRLVRL